MRNLDETLISPENSMHVLSHDTETLTALVLANLGIIRKSASTLRMSQTVYNEVLAGNYDEIIRPFLEANVKLRIDGKEMTPSNLKELQNEAQKPGEKTLLLDKQEISLA